MGGLLISQYVLLVWFSRALYIEAQLGGPSALGMHIILNRFYWFGCSKALYTWARLAWESFLISH